MYWNNNTLIDCIVGSEWFGCSILPYIDTISIVDLQSFHFLVILTVKLKLDSRLYVVVQLPATCARWLACCCLWACCCRRPVFSAACCCLRLLLLRCWENHLAYIITTHKFIMVRGGLDRNCPDWFGIVRNYLILHHIFMKPELQMDGKPFIIANKEKSLKYFNVANISINSWCWLWTISRKLYRKQHTNQKICVRLRTRMDCSS